MDLLRVELRIDNARDQFVRFYLGRDVRYFDIQSYRPSAGFLFSLLPPGQAPFDWAPYRRVFHRMREAQYAAWPVREHQLMRYFGTLLASEYGNTMLDKLAEWGWPVSRADRAWVRQEADGHLTDIKRADYLVSKGGFDEAEGRYRSVLAAMPDGPCPSSAASSPPTATDSESDTR